MQTQSSAISDLHCPSAPFFDPACPEGIYMIQLERAGERSVALQLIKASKECTTGSLMKEIKVDGVPYPQGVPDEWPSTLPDTGTLEFSYVKSPESHPHAVLDWKKIGALDLHFKKASSSESAKLSTILALAPFSNLYARHIARLLRRFEIGDAKITAACSLYVRCVDLEDGVQHILSSVSERDCTLIKEKLSFRACFRANNPTGHYALDLGVPHQYLLAITLKDAAAQEGTAVTWRNIMCVSLHSATHIEVLYVALRPQSPAACLCFQP
jgi:hypothetical protein